MKSIIGITGAFGSGKSTAAAIIESQGYKKIYLSSFLEKEAEAKGLPMTRKTLQDLGNKLREEKGPGILMKMAIKAMRDEDKIVIDGLRNLGEVDELRKHKEGILLAIIADRKIRYERLKAVKRRETLNLNLFRSLDLRDLGVNEKITGLQTGLCIALADVFVDSNSSMSNFRKDILTFLREYGQ
jgi:dephospho-CoA kinase